MKTLIIVFTISIIILVAVFIILAIMAFNKGWNSNKRSKLANMIKTKIGNLCNKSESAKNTLCYIINCISVNADCIANKFSHQYKYDDKYINNLTYDLLAFALNSNCLDSCGYTKNGWDDGLLNAVISDAEFFVNIYNIVNKKTASPEKINKDVTCVVTYLSTQYKPNQLFGMLFHFLLDIDVDGGIVNDRKNIIDIVQTSISVLNNCPPPPS